MLPYLNFLRLTLYSHLVVKQLQSKTNNGSQTVCTLYTSGPQPRSFRSTSLKTLAPAVIVPSWPSSHRCSEDKFLMNMRTKRGKRGAVEGESRKEGRKVDLKDRCWWSLLYNVKWRPQGFISLTVLKCVSQYYSILFHLQNTSWTHPIFLQTNVCRILSQVRLRTFLWLDMRSDYITESCFI